MPKDTLTLTLNGDVPPELFAKAIGHFSDLIRALSEEIAGPDEQADWSVSHLEGGSAVVEVKGVSGAIDLIERIVEAYGVTGQAIGAGMPIPYSDAVAKPARAITEVLNGHIKSVGFITDNYKTVVTEPQGYDFDKAEEPKAVSLGVVTGVVRAIWYSEKKITLAVHDAFNRVVYCRLGVEHKQIARDVGDRRVTITGLIERDPVTGLISGIRDVADVEISEDAIPGAFKRVRGILSHLEEGVSSQDIIERMYDAN